MDLSSKCTCFGVYEHSEQPARLSTSLPNILAFIFRMSIPIKIIPDEKTTLANHGL